MRYYIVVEGASGEAKVYPKWIQYTNSQLTQIYNLNDDRDNVFYLISGNGYPNYLSIIENAIEDVNNLKNFDLLVVAVDSEDKTYQEKYNEIKEAIDDKLIYAEFGIIIQHFCLETWALGNRIACRKNTTDTMLLEYKKVYNVRIHDPELLPSYNDMNRSQFAFRYLRCMINDWYPRASYTKSNPEILFNEDYFIQIKKRSEETNHIQSFRKFIDTFTGNIQVHNAFGGGGGGGGG
ncbi:MAG: hypothetical protein LBL56_05480, partial [Treponema sp.]|nr:hypothetical protein [Treponema sp.]